VSLFGGANWIFTQYDDELSGGVPNDGDELLFNFNAGISYQVADNFFLTGSYNFTHSDSDFDGREYDRNRYTIGTQFTF